VSFWTPDGQKIDFRCSDYARISTMERLDADIRAIPRLIFFASFACLSYEIALMRVFSISLWYHFAFMVISIAMLGIGASGTVLSLFPELRDLRRVSFYVFLLAIGIPLSYLLANSVPFDPAQLSWDHMQIFNVGLYYIILCVPFFCFGMIVSAAYTNLPQHASAMYAADLLGAGLGALAMVSLLSLGSPELSVFFISTLLFTGLLYEKDGKIRIFSLLGVAVNLAVLLTSPAFIQPSISPYKPFAIAMQSPGAEQLATAYSPYSRVDLFKSPLVRFAPGLSFTYLEPLPRQTGISIDAADIYAITDESDVSKLGFVKSLPSSIVYRMAAMSDVLIIEPRSGLASLTASQFGAQNIYAIDSNPLVLHVIREYGSRIGAPVYEHHAWSGLARTWLSASRQKFDVIDLSFMGSTPAGFFGFSEDYRYTMEAFTQYLSHLKPDGFLTLNLYIIPPPRIELRLLATLADAAERSGTKDVSRHVAALRSWDTISVLMKTSALTGHDIKRIKTFAREKRFDLVYYPGMPLGEGNIYIKMPGNEYAESFRQLLDINMRNQFVTRYLFDIRPVTDERPFFHYYLKFSSIRSIYHFMGQKWQYFVEEGYLLPILLIQVMVASLVLILLPLITRKLSDDGSSGLTRLRSLTYFAFLGLAYLFVEIAFIQKMILCLENPSTTASVVIASLLTGSGLGSILSDRIQVLKSPHVLLLLAGITGIYSFLLPEVIAALSPYPQEMKVILSVLLVVPAGILMGIPFPLGIKKLGSAAPGLIPWAWAVSGCFSVLAPVLATLIALSWGFQAVLLCGMALYLTAYSLIQWRWDATVKQSHL
jgi:hypothetical protein